MTDIASVEVAAQSGRRRLKLDPLWLALPAFVLLALFLILPTAQILSLSVLDKTGSLSGVAFVRIWNGPYLAVLSTTFSVALWTTALCLVLTLRAARVRALLDVRRRLVAEPPTATACSGCSISTPSKKSSM